MPSTISAETEDIWTSILSSVTKTKSIPVINVWILSDEQNAAFKLASMLKGDSTDNSSAVYGMSYSFASITDDDSEEVGRLGIYTLSADLIKVVDADKLKGMALIVLDWSSPMTFVKSLSEWHALVPDLRLTVIVTGSYNKKTISDDQLEYIQVVLRIMCLEYDAGLIYVNESNFKSVTTLKCYLRQLLFYPSKPVDYQTGTLKPEIITKDEIFIPHGWDSLGKIKLMNLDTASPDIATSFQNLSFEERCQAYEQTIPSPIIKELAVKPAEVLAEDEQVFLKREMLTLGSNKNQSASHSTPKQSVPVKKVTPVPPPVTEPVKEKITDNSTQNEVLANFFQSLLNKKSTVKE